MSEKSLMEKVRQQTLEVNSFTEIDISDLVCPIIAVYVTPEDYPEDCVARIFDLDRPMNIIIIRKSVVALREDIMKAFPNMVRFERAKNDVRCIYETWI